MTCKEHHPPAREQVMLATHGSATASLKLTDIKNKQMPVNTASKFNKRQPKACCKSVSWFRSTKGTISANLPGG